MEWIFYRSNLLTSFSTLKISTNGIFHYSRRTLKCCRANYSNKTWYWVGSGKPITLTASEWIENGPNGQHLEEYCTDIYIKQNPKNVIANNQIVLNDVPCRSSKYLWEFICEKVVVRSEEKEKSLLVYVLAIVGCAIAVVCLSLTAVMVLIRKHKKLVAQKDDEINVFGSKELN